MSEKELRKEIAVLKRKNKRLKAQNRKLKKQNQRLIKRNIRYQKKEFKTRHKEIERKEELQKNTRIENKIFRYSIAYASRYDKTFRCEIYTTEPKNENSVFLQLDNYLKKRITQNTKSKSGRQKIYASLSYLGFESERVGSNDIGLSKLNHIMFWVD